MAGTADSGTLKSELKPLKFWGKPRPPHYLSYRTLEVLEMVLVYYIF